LGFNNPVYFVSCFNILYYKIMEEYRVFPTRLVLDWRKRHQARAAVQLQIETILDRLPEVYDRNLYSQKCQLVYQHVYDSYYGAGKSLYVSITV